MTTETIHLLYVGLDERTEDRVTAVLEERQDSIETTTAADSTDAIKQVTSQSFDCVLSSDSLKDGTGIEFLRSVRESFPALPCILLAETLSDELVREAIDAGVTDYLPQRQDEAWFSLLADRITEVVTRYRTTERTSELERINTVIRKLNRVLVRASTADEIDQQICEIISQSEPYVFAWIGEHDAKTGVVTPRAAAGIEEGYLENITVTTNGEPTSQGPTGRAVSSQKIQVMQNIPEDPAYNPWREEALERGYRSSAAIPLVHDDTLYGVLNVYSDRVEAFDQAERKLLKEVGDDIALALHNIQVSEQVENLTETLRMVRRVDERLVKAQDRSSTITDIVDILSKHASFNCAFLALIDEDQIQFASDPDTRLTEEQAQEIHSETYINEVLEQDVLQIDNVTEPPYQQHSGDALPHEAVALPIRHQSRDHGVLTIHFRPGKTPSEEEIDLLKELGDDIAHALHRLQLSTELKEQEQQYEAVIENIHDGLVIVQDGVIQYTNPQITKLTEYSPEEIIGEQLTIFVSEEDQELVMRRYRERIEGGEPRETYEIEISSKDGATIPVEVSVGVFEYEGELATITAIRDISERINRTRHLRVLDRVMRHNFHNDMTIIQGYAQTIHDEAPNKNVAEDAELIISKSRQLLETIDKEREIVEIIAEPVEYTEANLVTAVQQVVATVREEYSDAAIDLDLPNEAIASATPAFPRALEELLTNAIIHNDQETTKVSIAVERQETTIRITIADNGPGIPDEELKVLTGEREIEPLYHGSGLGLWLVNWIVRRADGTLEFEANDPRGSIVTIKLQRVT